MLQYVEIFNILHRPPIGVEDPVALGDGQIAEQHAERDADEQQRLELELDGEQEEEACDEDHHHIAPLQIGKARGLPKEAAPMR